MERLYIVKILNLSIHCHDTKINWNDYNTAITKKVVINAEKLTIYLKPT